jgi:hypothetical protein
MPVPFTLRRALTVASLVVATAVVFGAVGRGQTTAPEIVLRASDARIVAGAWIAVADPSAAGGQALRHPDAGAPKLSAPLASPADFFEIQFDAAAGVAYRLWLRGRADGNHWANDSMYAQFSNSVTAAGAAQFRIGSTSGTSVVIEDCSGCGLSGWGWQDNGYGTGVLGPLIYFATPGIQTLRIQGREDGVTVDQIVLSPQRHLTAAPGATKNDNTILTPSDPGAPPSATLVRGPFLQQAADTSIRIVWATRESGEGQVRYARQAGGGGDAFAAAARRHVAAVTSGLPFDYYDYEATIQGLTPSSSYEYELYLNAGPVGPGAEYAFITAPEAGTGTVSFIVYGDSGTGSSEQRQLASLMTADSFDIALHAGDIAYGNGGGTGDATWQTFLDWFFGIYDGWLPYRPIFPSEGNHDSRPSNGDGRAYLDLFSLPNGERYYSFDYGPVHFVALDTEYAFQDTARRAAQLAWLESDLAATSQPWKVAFYHRSPFSAGGEHGSDLAVRNAFAPVFERYGVQLSLSAHEHDYERTVPVAIAGGPPVVYVVAGGGGAPLYPAGTASWTAHSASRHHYVRASADACTLTLEAVALTGAVFDGTTLSRCPAPPPPATSEIVLYTVDASPRAGAWTLVADAGAAAGMRLWHPNQGAARVATPLASPASYFELAFDAAADVPYRLWIRGKAEANSWANDSAYVQFSGSVDAAGQPKFRIGTTSATTVTLEDCLNCGVAGWGWQDNGYGTGVLGPLIEFAAAGPQRLRIQTREDGFSIDQIVLSPSQYLSSAPGALKNDTVIVPR